jgi:hypothetical protein
MLPTFRMYICKRWRFDVIPFDYFFASPVSAAYGLRGREVGTLVQVGPFRFIFAEIY